jgi:hypothetical protein
MSYFDPQNIYGLADIIGGDALCEDAGERNTNNLRAALRNHTVKDNIDDLRGLHMVEKIKKLRE